MTQVNLLPESCRHLTEHVRQMRLWAGLCAVIGLILTAATLVLSDQQSRLAHQALTTEHSTAPLRVGVEAGRMLLQQAANSRSVVENTVCLEQRDAPIEILQATVDSFASLGSKVELKLFKIEDEAPLSTLLAATGDKQRMSLGKRVSLAGLASADEDVSMLIGNLKSTGVFSEVALQSAQAVTDDAASLRSFYIYCQYP